MPDQTPKCAMCGQPFERKRSTKRFCGDPCRKQYNALPARIETAVEAALLSIRTAQDLLNKHPEFVAASRPMLETVIQTAQAALPRKPYTRRSTSAGAGAPAETT